ncbi:MAG: tetratricopeptide repeat protein [Pyrinomonadaceae bacterium]|nr:tetratricopeptide repeat protein [Pyrinomonadaceae bacterium]
MEKKIACYCQSCRAANNLGETICRKCGTRLLLVVFPQSLKYDTNYVPSYYEDHILERVSLLELRLAQATEQLAMALEFISREAKSFQRDHTLLQSFFETLEKFNPDLSEMLSQNTLELLNEKKEKQTANSKREKLLHEIFAAHDAKQTELFAHLVKEGVKLLDAKEEKQAFLNLERAALVSPKNVPLLCFIAEHLFRADKFDSAKKTLEQAFEIEPQNAKVLLLLGVIYGDAAETEKARKLLSVLVSAADKTFCVNYVWGMLAAFEANWTESLAAFKQALEDADAPEIHYLIGAGYFQTGKFDAALNHFQAAISRDIKYADAWFMQSVIYEFAGNEESANNARAAALESRETGAQCMEFLKKKNFPKLEIALPFQHFKREKNHLLTGGSRRLSQFFRERIYQAIE